MSFVDKSGHERHEVRLRWWDPGHEEGNIVENVPPHDRAIKREIQGYGETSTARWFATAK
jgi:hypothetical protein